MRPEIGLPVTWSRPYLDSYVSHSISLIAYILLDPRIPFSYFISSLAVFLLALKNTVGIWYLMLLCMSPVSSCQSNVFHAFDALEAYNRHGQALS